VEKEAPDEVEVAKKTPEERKAQEKTKEG